MSRLLTCTATGLGFCFCTACSSLLGSALGNDKPSTVPPSVTSGRRRSVFLLVIALAIALTFQYAVAPYLVENNNDLTGFIADNWLDGCTKYDDKNDSDLQKDCAGNMGVYRAGGSAVLFFLLAAIGVACKPTFNREVWPAKYVLFLFLCGSTIFIPNEPLFSDIFLNIARVGGAIFIMLQQIIIIDMAYAWNDNWVERSNEAEREEVGSGNKWLAALLGSAFTMFLLAIGGIVVLFLEFTGCQSNDAFVIVTVIMMVLITAAQMSGEEGNLLTSAAVSLWAVVLCYTAVSKNPNESCNPQVGEQDRLNIALGLIVTIISMCWTGWSYTAEEKLNGGGGGLNEPLVEQPTAPSTSNTESRKVSGVVTGGRGDQEDQEHAERDGDDENDNRNQSGASNPENNNNNNSPRPLSNSWKLNIMLASISCWMSMALTGWGEISSDGTSANPAVGRVAMWIVIASQWFVLTLYLWTLVAPRLFPDRDFS